MFFVADFHVHSRYSRATSGDMNLEGLCRGAQLKGIHVIGTGDFTHPQYFREIQEKLEPAEEGLFKLKPEIEAEITRSIPERCRTPVRFMISVEISSIYSKKGRTRKIHNLVFAPSFAVAKKINDRLNLVGNLASDGRPILGLDAKELLKIVLDASPEAMLIPCHAWTPHFSIFGSESGFDSIEECFDELAPNIFAIETGLSSDPAMNWRLSQLDRITLISNSDAHSLPKLGREANVFDTEMSYPAIRKSLQTKKGFVLTIEFFPEEGKYHYDGHRNCQTCLHPDETKKNNGLCPACGSRVTVGVMHRVNLLADRVEGYRPPNAILYKSIIPLQEIIGEAFEVGVQSQAVQREFLKIVAQFGNEFRVLLKTPIEELRTNMDPRIAEGIVKMREGKIKISPGYDGEFGKVQIFDRSEKRLESTSQMSLF